MLTFLIYKPVSKLIHEFTEVSRNGNGTDQCVCPTDPGITQSLTAGSVRDARLVLLARKRVAFGPHEEEQAPQLPEQPDAFFLREVRGSKNRNRYDKKADGRQNDVVKPFEDCPYTYLRSDKDVVLVSYNIILPAFD